FEHRHGGEELQPLEGASHAQRGALLRLPTRDLTTIEEDRSLRADVARNGIKERGLARPVGADQPHQLAGIDRERHSVRGYQAGVTDRNLTRFQQRHAGPPPISTSSAAAARRGPKPLVAGRGRPAQPSPRASWGSP